MKALRNRAKICEPAGCIGNWEAEAMPSAYEFGDFRVDPARRLLTHRDRAGLGLPIAIGERALDVLLVLIEHAGQVVSKRDLLASVWPGGAVEDSNLTVQLSNLRRAIDAAPPAPSLIKTIHGRGYVLAVPVHEVDAAPARTGIIRPDKAAIAVLPFRSMAGGASGQDEFADGLAEDITTALSSIRSLAVVAHKTAFDYRDRKIDIQQVGRELGVRYLLEGGVRRSGLRTRVSGHLVDVASGTEIWSDHFDGITGDSFDLQDLIASKVVRALEPRLQQAEIARAQSVSARALTAYELFLQALGLLHELSEASLRLALPLLEQSIVADPSHAASYGLAAWCCRLLVNYGRPDDAGIRHRGVAMARIAVDRGRDDPLPLCLGGAQIALLGGEHAEGLSHIERALTLNATSARAWELCGWVSASVGEHARSVDCFRQSMRLNPSDQLSALPYAGIAWPYFFMGRYDEGIAWADKACLEMPGSALPLRPKIACAAMAGRIEDVEQTRERLQTIIGDLSIARLMRIDVSRSRAQRDVVEAAMRKAGLPG